MRAPHCVQIGIQPYTSPPIDVSTDLKYSLYARSEYVSILNTLVGNIA